MRQASVDSESRRGVMTKTMEITRTHVRRQTRISITYEPYRRRYRLEVELTCVSA